MHDSKPDPARPDTAQGAGRNPGTKDRQFPARSSRGASISPEAG